MVMTTEWVDIHDEVMGAVDAIIDSASIEYTPSGFLACVEDDLVGLRDSYDLTTEELDALGATVAKRLEIKHVLCRDEWGQPFIQFFVLPKNEPRR